ncbi:programmed cell death protein 2 [Atheta coriaria]|uniref:programmed cell death protein 2 n=1 Tax=Dalotia coriaria TaxID=877792 RepID=UPI0031F477C7
MSRVDIGFAEPCEPWRLLSTQFPSKLGGKPAWLSLKDLPNAETLQCTVCSNPKTFLCQVYAPHEDCENNFHRSVYIFACRNATCCKKNDNTTFAVFRDNLPRLNDYYSFDPPPEDTPTTFNPQQWQKLCALCGCGAEKSCGKCKTPYCSRQHQVLHWKESHKTTCSDTSSDNGAGKSSVHLLKEFELVIEPEELEAKQEVDVEEQLRACDELQRATGGELADVEESELDRHAAVDGDRTFTRFRKRVDCNPEQVLRYERDGEPLWIAETPRPEEVPQCECGARRRFEFQVMPQFLATVNEHELDFGVLAVYTCEKSCWGGKGYKKEFIFKQDVAD